VAGRGGVRVISRDSDPDLVGAPFHPRFVAFPWRDDASAWGAWRDGTTGYPIVDAAARQLSREGPVPNRVRMVAASFLTKHLMIDWRRGAAHCRGGGRAAGAMTVGRAPGRAR
jgi:deoxyribodipyrimidine photolyase